MTQARTNLAGQPPHAHRWLVERCRTHRLSPTQRRVAQFLVDTLPDAAFLSTMEAAARAGVSQPTVTRFAATLGFATYADFRAAVREVVLHGDPGVDVADSPPATDPIANEQASLAALRPTLDSPAMAMAVDAIAGADVLGVVGMRASASLASYLGYFAQRILPDVRVVTDGDAADDALVQIAAADHAVLLVLAMPRYPASMVRALRNGRRLGLTTILVIDSPLVDFASDADQVLVAPVSTGMVFDTHAAPMLLGMALLDGCASAHRRRTQARLEAHEARIDTWMHHPGPQG